MNSDRKQKADGTRKEEGVSQTRLPHVFSNSSGTFFSGRSPYASLFSVSLPFTVQGLLMACVSLSGLVRVAMEILDETLPGHIT